MMLGAPVLEAFDRCRRKWQYEYADGWRPLKISPLGAVYSALHAVLTADPYPGPSLAREHVIRLAGERGMATDRPDAYDIAVHHAHLAEVLARVMRQPTAPAIKLHPPVALRLDPAPAISPAWQPASYLIHGGTRLFRFVLVDHWDDNRLLSELHSWRTVGDVVATKLPMTIRVLVVGSSRNGRRISHWTRARRHKFNKALRFARRTDKTKGWAEGWEWVYRELSSVGPDAWVEGMARDCVLNEMAFNQTVRVPDPYQCQRVREDMVEIGREMQRNVRYPLTRSACDMVGRQPCPFQCSCLAPVEMSVEATGMFVKAAENAGIVTLSL